MAIKIVSKLVPVVMQLVKDLKDGKLSADERDELIRKASLAIAEIIQAVSQGK